MICTPTARSASTDTITVDVAEEIAHHRTIMIGDLSTPTSATYYNRHTALRDPLHPRACSKGLTDGDVIGTVQICPTSHHRYATVAKGYRVNVWIGNTDKTELTTDKMSAADIEGLTHIGVDLRFEARRQHRRAPLYFEMHSRDAHHLRRRQPEPHRFGRLHRHTPRETCSPILPVGRSHARFDEILLPSTATRRPATWKPHGPTSSYTPRLQSRHHDGRTGSGCRGSRRVTV